MSVCARQPTDLDHIFATVNIRLQFCTTQIDQSDAILLDAYATVSGPYGYRQPYSTTYQYTHSNDIKGPPYKPFGLIGQDVTKSVRQVTEQAATI